jgi:hypothetical protein
MSWRVAQALLTMRAEVDRKWPDRERASDGGIGDERHAQLGTASDHNPWVKDSNGIGVVRAFDIDAGRGLLPTRAQDDVGDTVSEVARLAGKAGHPALMGGGYVIYEGKIASAESNPPWSWRKHTGDAHESHPHVSVGRKASAYDSRSPWGIVAAQIITSPVGGPATPATPAGAAAFPTLKVGDTGDRVKLVQRFLWGSARAKASPVYGKFEATTKKAVEGYQRMRGLPITGIVDTATWAPIRQALSI